MVKSDSPVRVFGSERPPLTRSDQQPESVEQPSVRIRRRDADDAHFQFGLSMSLVEALAEGEGDDEVDDAVDEPLAAKACVEVASVLVD